MGAVRWKVNDPLCRNGGRIMPKLTLKGRDGTAKEKDRARAADIKHRWWDEPEPCSISGTIPELRVLLVLVGSCRRR